jgi:hypothetical protein
MTVSPQKPATARLFADAEGHTPMMQHYPRDMGSSS